MENLISKTICQHKIIPVIAIDHPETAKSLGMALLDGGLPCAEITFRTEAAHEVIDILRSNFDELTVGAGTILTVEQAKGAVQAGAQFIVSPGIHRGVVEWCLDHNVEVFPGVTTPTDIATALDYDLRILKFFPAEVMGGVRALRALAAPYDMVSFIPTGGLNPTNLEEYLKQPFVFACGGSWLVRRNLISEGRFDEIRDLVLDAVEIVRQVGEGNYE